MGVSRELVSEWAPGRRTAVTSAHTINRAVISHAPKMMTTILMLCLGGTGVRHHRTPSSKIKAVLRVAERHVFMDLRPERTRAGADGHAATCLKFLPNYVPAVWNELARGR
jgi:hypothetical protein